jgi:predicted Rossmann fold nucleotide-binding protein DprA/Smf involved in DNA uptake
MTPALLRIIPDGREQLLATLWPVLAKFEEQKRKIPKSVKPAPAAKTARGQVMATLNQTPMTTRAVAEAIGRPVATVAQVLRECRLAGEITRHVTKAPIHNGGYRRNFSYTANEATQ